MAVNVVQTFDSPLASLIDADNSVFFTTDDERLGVSNGTGSGTSIFAGDGDGEEYEGLNGRVFFDGFSSASGEEPFVNNGTVDSTTLLRDINPIANETSDPLNFTSVGEVVYFTAFNEENGIALYSSDGTAEGTRLVADISEANSNPFGELVDFNGTLYFAGDGANGIEIWSSDGTAEGTQSVISFENSRTISGLTATEENIFFVRSSVRELWSNDGTAEGTQLLGEINPQELTSVEDNIFFTADDGSNSRELWTSDGTPDGTRLVEDILPEQRRNGSPVNGSSSPENLTDVGGLLYFTADDGVNGRELWISDGTQEQTRLVSNLTEGEGSSSLSSFTAVGDTLYFIKDGRELWQSEGTIDSTFQIEPDEIDLGGTTTPEFQNPEQLIEVDNQLYFAGEAYSREEGDYVPALLTEEDNNTVFRLLNVEPSVQFYTTSISERDEFLATGNFESEGASFTAVDPSAEGAEEVYRFFNESTGVHLYTTDENERDNIIDTQSQFAFEGEVFNAYPTQVEGSIPIYRFLNESQGVHLYTPDENERAFVEENLPNYQSEGIAYYALPLAE